MCSQKAHLSEAVDTVKALAHEHVNATRERTAVFMVLLSGENRRGQGVGAKEENLSLPL